MVGFKNLLVAALASLAAAAPPFAVEERGIGPIKPSDDPFYAVPTGADFDNAKPGDILRTRKTPYPIAALSIKPIDLKGSYQFLYKSTDSHGNDTATVLTVLIPHNADLSKVLSYQVAEDAAYINCAPSYNLQLGASNKLFGSAVTQAELALMDGALQQGWVVISPDHEGPKGAWLARENAAHLILDGIRAAINSADTTGISKDAIFAMWGYSGGAITSTAAAEIKDDYAPELNIVGAAVGGHAPDIMSVVNTCNKGPYAGIIPGGIQGLCNMFPDLQKLIDENLKPKYKKKFDAVKTQCLVPNAASFLFADIFDLFNDAESLFQLPFVVDLLKRNNLGHGVPKIPMFVYKGVLDDLSPVKDTDKLVDYYCSNGAASLQYYRDATAIHGSMAVVGAGRALGFLHSVMNGEKQPSGCKTQNVFSSLLDFQNDKYLPKYIINLLLDILGKPVGPIMIG